MKKKFLTAFFLIGFFLLNEATFCQSKTAHGYVIDRQSNKLIDSAEVRIEYSDAIVYTDEYGNFNIEVEKQRSYLLIHREGYQTQRILLPPGYPKRALQIKLVPNSSEIIVDTQTEETPMYKNAASLSLLELINVTIGIRYERFLSEKSSLGLHSSLCLYGRNPYTMGSEYDVSVSYSGLKISPFYRYYPMQKGAKGLFIEGKMHVGYYYFNDIRYTHGSNAYPIANVSMDMWSVGAGLAVGIMLKLPKTEHGLINISMGYQYFPTDVPEKVYREISGGTVLTFDTDNYWWYFTGPGAVFELKCTIGGLF